MPSKIMHRPGSTRHRLPSVWRWLLLPLTLLCCSCVGRQQIDLTGEPTSRPDAPGGVTTAQLGLPAPSVLRATSGGQIDALNGADFDASVNQHASAAATIGSLAPNWTAQNPAVGGLAYGLYTFTPDVAADVPVLHLSWVIAPAAGKCWIGLADYARDSWTWTAWNSGQTIPLDLQSKNIKMPAGTVPVVVLITGTKTCTLAKLRIGDNVAPSVAMTLSKSQDRLPFKLTVDASTSSDPDGVINHYDYDFDGDGVYDLIAVGSSAEVIVTQPGSFACIVRVTDDDDAQVTGGKSWDTGFSTVWSINNAAYATYLRCLRVAPDGSYYVAGSSQPVGSSDKHALLLKYNADSSLAWARQFSSPRNDFATGLAIAPDGGVFMTGSYDSDGLGQTDSFLTRFTPAGVLTWQRHWGAHQAVFDDSVAVDSANDRVYVGSTLNTGGANGYDSTLLRFDGDGTWIWGRSWGATNSEQARGVAVDASGNALLVVRDQAAKKLGGLLKFNAAGSQLSKLEFGKATVDIDPYGISLEASTGGIALQGSVVYSDSSGGPFALVLNSDQTLRWSKQISDPSAPDETFFDSHFAADGWLWLSGSLVNLGIVAWFTSDTMGQRIWAYPASSTYNGFDFASDGTALLAGYSAGPGPNLWVNSVHSTTTLSPTLSVPAADAVVYNAAPTASTGAVTNVVSVASPQQAALVTKFYEPLP